jgi:type II secretory pathway component PulF
VLKFDFEGMDEAGQAQRGQIEATDLASAARWVADQGWKAKTLRPTSARMPTTPVVSTPVRPAAPQPVATPGPRPVATPGPRPVAAPQGYDPWEFTGYSRAGEEVRGQIEAPFPEFAVRQLSNDEIRVLRLKNLRTKDEAVSKADLSNHRSVYLLLASVADVIKAGVSPYEAFSQVATHTSDPELSAAMKHAARGAMDGRSISDVLDLYPGLFEPHVVGFIRAGERGGYLAEALGALVDQLDSAIRFRRTFWWVLIAIFCSIAVIPITAFGRFALFTAWDRAERSAGASGPFDVLATFGRYFMWPTLPVVVALGFVVWGLRRYFNRLQWRTKRHRIASKFPGIAAPAKHEAVIAFTYHLGKLSRSGISPREAWWLSANAIPNLALRNRVVSAGAPLKHGSKLSEVAAHAPVLPAEFATVVKVGEQTGNQEDGMTRMAEFARSERDRTMFMGRMALSHVGFSIMMLAAGLAIAYLLWTWLIDLPRHVARDLEPSLILPFLR